MFWWWFRTIVDSESAKNPSYPGLLRPSRASSKEHSPNCCHKPPLSVEMLSDIQTPDGRQQARPPCFLPSKEDLEEASSTCTSVSRFSFSDGGDSEFSDSDLGEEFQHVLTESKSNPTLPARFLDTRGGSSPICRSPKAKRIQQNIEISQIIPQVARLSQSLEARDVTESTIMRCRHFIELMRLLGIELVFKLNYGFECSCEDEYLCAFEQGNVEVRSLAFDDGSVPSKALTKDFLKQCRAHSVQSLEARQLNPIALHCKAGLGRTGVMLGLYATEHYEVDGQAFHGWVRMCRPGTVQTTEQERYLRKMVPRGKKNRSLSETISSMLPATIPRLSKTPSLFRRRSTSN